MVRYVCIPATCASDRSVPRKISRSNPDSTPAISFRCFAINSFMALCSSQDVVFSLNLLILSRIEAPSTFGCGSAALCPLWRSSVYSVADFQYCKTEGTKDHRETQRGGAKTTLNF